MGNKKIAQGPPPLKAPPHLECPLCFRLFSDPCLLDASGHTFDLKCIQNYVKKEGNVQCPVTQVKIRGSFVTPNRLARTLVADFLLLNPNCVEQLTPREDFGPIKLIAKVSREEKALRDLLQRLEEATEQKEELKLLKDLHGLTKFECDIKLFVSIRDAVPLVMYYIMSKNSEARSYAYYILKNLADSKFCHAVAIRDMFDALESLLKPSLPDEVRYTAAQVICMLMVNKSCGEIAVKIVASMTSLVSALAVFHVTDGGLKCDDGLFCLELIAKSGLEASRFICRHDGFLNKMVHFLVSKDSRSDAIGLLQWMCRDKDQADMIANHPGLVPCVFDCLKVDEARVRYNTFCAIFHLLKSDSFQIFVHSPNVLGIMTNIMYNPKLEDLLYVAELKSAFSAYPAIVERLEKHRPDKAVVQPTVDLPEHLECPLCLSMFRDPVILAASGHSFDFDCLERYLDSGKTICPMTRVNLLSNPYAIPNVAMRGLIAAYHANHPNPGEALVPRDSFEPIRLGGAKNAKLLAIRSLVEQLRTSKAPSPSLYVGWSSLMQEVQDTHVAIMLGNMPEALTLLLNGLRTAHAHTRFFAASILADLAKQIPNHAKIVEAPFAIPMLLDVANQMTVPEVRQQADRALRELKKNPNMAEIINAAIQAPVILCSHKKPAHACSNCHPLR